MTPSIIPEIPSRPVDFAAVPIAKGIPPAVLILSWGAKLTLCRGKNAGGALEPLSERWLSELAKRKHDSRSSLPSLCVGVGAGNVQGDPLFFHCDGGKTVDDDGKQSEGNVLLLRFEAVVDVEPMEDCEVTEEREEDADMAQLEGPEHSLSLDEAY